MKRDFLHITDFTTEEIWEVLELSKSIKAKLKMVKICLKGHLITIKRVILIP